jgi:hypothetical protein
VYDESTSEHDTFEHFAISMLGYFVVVAARPEASSRAFSERVEIVECVRERDRRRVVARHDPLSESIESLDESA